MFSRPIVRTIWAILYIIQEQLRYSQKDQNENRMSNHYKKVWEKTIFHNSSIFVLIVATTNKSNIKNFQNQPNQALFTSHDNK